ncbi:MAG: hypothetical protein Q9218_001572 [Villophora microphyllina]
MADDKKRDDYTIEMNDLGRSGKAFDQTNIPQRPGPSVTILPSANNPVFPILSYCGSSILMTVTNKYVLSGFGFNLNLFLLAVQSIVCVVAIQVCKSSGIITYRDFNSDEARKWFPVSLLLIGMIYTSTKALQFLSIPVYTIFKNLTIILIAYGEVLWFGGSVTGMALFSFGLMVLSSVIAAWADIQHALQNYGHSESEASARVSTLNAGYMWMLVNCICSAAYVLGMRKRIKLTNFKDFDTMFYNNVLSIPILLIASLLAENWSSANIESNFPPLQRNRIVLAMIFSGLSSVFISYTSAWCVRITSSTTYSMVGFLNKLPLALSGLIFFDAPVTVPSVSAIGVGFVSGIVYALAKVKQSSAPKTGILPTSAPPISASSQSARDSLNLSFTQGFLLGQLSVVLLIGAFIKFFIFGDPPSPEVTASTRALARQNRDHGHKRSFSVNSSPSAAGRSDIRVPSSNILRHPPPLTTPIILAKTYYNVNSHQPESLDWFNVLIAQTIAQFRTDAHQDEAILTSLTEVLNSSQKPDFLSSIKVTEVSLGEDFPIFSNCRVHPVDDGSAGPDGAKLQARMDVDLSDLITLGLETKIILNWPKPLTAILPVALAVSVVRFSGTLSVSFLPSASVSSPSTSATNHLPPQQPLSTTPTSLAFSFLPDYRLDLSVRSLVGSRSRLQDIPKIAQMVENRLHAWIDERCVQPRVQQVVLPSLWPRKKNTRGPFSEEEEEGLGVKPAELVRDVREEARKEVEEERRRDREHRDREATGYTEGLRWRNKTEGEAFATKITTIFRQAAVVRLELQKSVTLLYAASIWGVKMDVSQASHGLGDPRLLETIDKLVELNIGESVALPQSSVLEGLTGLPFPRDSTLCTRFATQITFRRASTVNIKVSIIPDKNTSKDDAERLRDWKKTGLTSLDRKVFSQILEEVHEAMGIGEGSQGAKKSFSDDVLKIEVAGPDQQHLSVVDVPGIFRKITEGVTTAIDMSNVRSMVERYMQNSRSVILPVVPSNVDIATQEILEMAEKHDRDGKRTLGVLTKPDLVDEGAEQNVLDLMQGTFHKLNLGWCMVKNPGQKDLKNEDGFDRHASEKAFFKNEMPWSTLDKDRVGIESLRFRLVELLTEIVRREFSHVRSDVVRTLKAAEKKLHLLGPCRETREQQQKYLLDLATQFQALTTQALAAHYGSDDAFESKPNLTLATAVIDRNEKLSNDIRDHGHTMEFKAEVVDVPSWESVTGTAPFDIAPPVEMHATRYHWTSDELDDLLSDEQMPTASKNDIMQWLGKLYKGSRGFELGTFNASLVPIMFQKQSSKWNNLALGYTSDIVSITHNYISALLEEICGDDRTRAGLMSAMMDKLVERYKRAIDQTCFILEVEHDPWTNNHYFADNLEKWQYSTQKRMKELLRGKAFHANGYGQSILLSSLDHTTSMSNLQSTVQQLHDILKSYYKVARKRFVDNVCMQAADRHLTRGKDAAVKVFSPFFVSDLTPEEMERIAGEDVLTKRKRAELTREVENLKQAKKLLVTV